MRVNEEISNDNVHKSDLSNKNDTATQIDRVVMVWIPLTLVDG